MRERERGSVESPALGRLLHEGDAGAFDGFLQRQWAPLLRYVESFSVDPDDAHDLAQEAFVRLWEERTALRPDASPRPYLFRIARNLAHNLWKRQEVHGRLNAGFAEGVAVPTPAVELDAAELRAVVRRAIDALPKRRREAFVLAHLEDLPHREIAEIMGISVQGVANQVSAALADLRSRLHPYVKGSASPEVLRSG